MKNFSYNKRVRNQNIKPNRKKTPYADFQQAQKDWHVPYNVRLFMCSHVTTDAIIEMFVCARDGVTGWRNGGPSLTGKTEQEEQTPY